MIVDFYKDLFSTSREPIQGHQLDIIECRVDDSMLKVLNKSYHKDDIVYALREMHPFKSPGPEGLRSMFYKKYWEVVGDEICDLVLGFLNCGHIPADLNHTLVVLILKVCKAVHMKDLGPISLCNVSYKIISKVLTNRLKQILPTLIDEHQSAFVPGRLITNNILLSSELFHFRKHKQAKRRGYMALKLDMSKAYDRIEWDYLHAIMMKIGFPAQWVDT